MAAAQQLDARVLMQAAAADLAIQWGACAVSCLLRTERYYDATGALTFALLALRSHARGAGGGTARARLLTALTVAWSARLGSYLFSRISEHGKDTRFDGVRDNARVFFLFWTLQAVWVFTTLLPVLFVNATSGQPPLGWGDALGTCIWVAGFSLEAVADAQKRRWRANPANKHAWIDTGLWSLARHPNYCGECGVWVGASVVAASGLRLRFGLAAFASPAFVAFLLLRVSGVPLLLRSARKKWGSDPQWRAYVARTRLLVPVPW